MSTSETRLFLAELRLGRPAAVARLRAALCAAGGSVSAAATALGVGVSSLYRARDEHHDVRRVFDVHGLGRTGAAERALEARMERAPRRSCRTGRR